MKAFFAILFALHMYGASAIYPLFLQGPLSPAYQTSPAASYISLDDIAEAMIVIPKEKEIKINRLLVELNQNLIPGSKVHRFIYSIPTAVQNKIGEVATLYGFASPTPGTSLPQQLGLGDLSTGSLFHHHVHGKPQQIHNTSPLYGFDLILSSSTHKSESSPKKHKKGKKSKHEKSLHHLLKNLGALLEDNPDEGNKTEDNSPNTNTGSQSDEKPSPDTEPKNEAENQNSEQNPVQSDDANATNADDVNLDAVLNAENQNSEQNPAQSDDANATNVDDLKLDDVLNANSSEETSKTEPSTEDELLSETVQGDSDSFISEQTVGASQDDSPAESPEALVNNLGSTTPENFLETSQEQLQPVLQSELDTQSENIPPFPESEPVQNTISGEGVQEMVQSAGAENSITAEGVQEKVESADVENIISEESVQEKVNDSTAFGEGEQGVAKTSKPKRRPSTAGKLTKKKSGRLLKSQAEEDSTTLGENVTEMPSDTGAAPVTQPKDGSQLKRIKSSKPGRKTRITPPNSSPNNPPPNQGD